MKTYSFLFFLLIFLSSCYTVRIVSRSTPEPDPLNTSNHPFYKGKKVHSIDTTISLKLIEEGFKLNERCEAFHSFEYRVTLGSALLGAVTFSRKRRVNVKYVSIKPD